jgi:beta-lactamase class C
MLRSFSLLLFFGVAMPHGKSQNFADKAAQQFMLEGEIAGMFIDVVKNGRVLYQKSFGFAGLIAHKPITQQTCFELGSVSKVFVADLIYQLHQKNNWI